MDFVVDYVNLLASILDKEGVTYEPYDKHNPSLFISRFFEFKSRQLEPCKKKVIISKKLLASSIYTSGSNKHQSNKVAVDNLKKMIESGNDVRPYQSKTIKDFSYPELMFLDWGVLHFHLGPHTKGKFSERTGPLLFARELKDMVFFIDIKPHGAWADFDLVQTLDNELPQLTAAFTVDAIDIAKNPTPKELISLRQAGINSMIKLPNGKILSPIGGGISTAKTSIQCLRQADYHVNEIRLIQGFVEQNIQKVFNSLGVNNKHKIKLDGVDFDNRLFSVTSSDNSKVAFLNY